MGRQSFAAFVPAPTVPASQTGSGTTSSTTLLAVASITAPAIATPALHIISGCLIFQPSVASDQFDVALDISGGAVLSKVRWQQLTVNAFSSATPASWPRLVAANTAVTYRLTIQRVAGTGTATIPSNAQLTQVNVAVIPYSSAS